MSDVTRILSAIEEGDPQAASKLLPLVYDELRRLAAQQLAREKPGQTLEATALVHEAYVRLVASGPGRRRLCRPQCQRHRRHRTLIAGNQASKSNPDVWGTITIRP